MRTTHFLLLLVLIAVDVFGGLCRVEGAGVVVAAYNPC